MIGAYPATIPACLMEPSMNAMTHYFAVEDAPQGQHRITVRDTSRSLVVTSTLLPELRLAQEAMRGLCIALTRDWCYEIVNRRKTGLCFTIQIERPRIVCISRTFSSGDSMEHEIALLKTRAAALTAFSLHLGDILGHTTMLRDDDDDATIAARLRALA